MQAKLILEDGKIFSGKSCGLSGTAFGEVVFNTSMAGYQEIITDPSYAGQIITFTYPLVGNYGTRREFQEAPKTAARGVIMKEISDELDSYLKEQGLIGIYDLDTRTLTKHIRKKGAMRGVITTEKKSSGELQELVTRSPRLSEQDLVQEVSCEKSYILPGGKQVIVVIDLGVKYNILRSLTTRGCTVIVVPADSEIGEILRYRPHGILLSNGPGDPSRLNNLVATVKEILGRIPLMGICLGHQVLGLALGGKTYKLKFGHRGGNHPVKNIETGRVVITSQNHGYALKKDSLPLEVKITHVNLNDGTVEGIRHTKLPVFSVQYHPEGAPGPRDSDTLFDAFLEMAFNKRGEKNA